MLEVEDTRETMDKKSANRPSTGTAKADGKKSDNGNGKNPRFTRRREPNAARPKYDPGASRRPVPQRSGGLDKRPRTRGYNNGRKAEEVTGDYEPEIGSPLRPGGKKTNLNHLLNFTYEPRGQTTSVGRGGIGWKRRNKWAGNGTLKYNKEQFLQANCQFVVRDGIDYSVHAADPDTLVDWDLIEQVRIVSHEDPSCPICLYPPTAAKMTRCGHIYCWPCILHYLSLGDKDWRKCPICYESIHQKDLKSVMALATHAFSVGEHITMKLMRREKGSTYTMPSRQWQCRDGQPHNVADNVDVRYAKLLQATEIQIEEILDEENAALLQQKKEEGDSLEGSYVQSALEQLNIRAEKLKLVKETKAAVERAYSHSEGSGSSSAEEATELAVVTAKPPPKVLTYASAFDDEEKDIEDEGQVNKSDGDVERESLTAGVESEAEAAPDGSETSDTGIPPTEAAAENPDVEEAAESVVLSAAVDHDHQRTHVPSGKTTEYYFYQAEDGQHIYLHSVNARCLVHEYGSWEKCPDTITAAIVELEGVSMGEDLRRRLRYLSHLPLTCEFQVTELNLLPPTMSKETLGAFSEELKKRERQRRNKKREDKKTSRRMQEVERRQMGMGEPLSTVPGLRVSLDSQKHFPQYQGGDSGLPAEGETPFDMDSVASSSVSSPHSTPLITPIGSPDHMLNPHAPVFVPGGRALQAVSATSSDEGHQTGGGMSFAQMLREGKSKGMPEAWPKTSPYPEGKSRRPHRRLSDSDSDCEDRIPVPVYQDSFGNAIQEALDSFLQHEDSAGMTIPEVAVNAGTATPEVASKGKKKKKVKKLLFSTTMPIAK